MLISNTTVDVAVRPETGPDVSARFENHEDGLRSFADWFEQQVALDDEGPCHSSVAAIGPQDDVFFSSPFLAFAYDATDNTFIWSAARIQEMFGDHAASALGMLNASALEHGRKPR